MERYRRIANLALPIIGAMVSQNVLNLVDTAIVGSLGDAAIAAVSTSSFVSWVSIAFVTGLSMAVQAMAARRAGEGRIRDATGPLNAGLAISLLLGLPLTALLWLSAPVIYPFVNDDPAVVALAVPYLRIRALGMVAVGMNFSFRGYYNGIDRPRLYLSTLVIMHTFNIALSAALVFGAFGLPTMGTQGVAVGTTSAVWLGVGTYVVLGMRNAQWTGFPGDLPDLASIRALLALALPSSLQQLLFAASFLALFGIIGSIGTTEVAAAGVLINVTLVAVLPGMALGMASATLVGSALGRKDPEDAERWGWDVVRVGVVGLGLLGLPMLLVPEICLAPFLWGRAETIAVAAGPLRLVGGFMALDAVGMVLMQSLAGAGATRPVAIASVVLQWLVFLPLAWLLGPVLGYGLVGIWSAQVGQRFLQAILFAILWQRGTWKTVRV